MKECGKEDAVGRAERLQRYWVVAMVLGSGDNGSGGRGGGSSCELLLNA